MNYREVDTLDYLRRSLITFLACSLFINVFLVYQFTNLGETRDKIIVGGSALLAIATYFQKNINQIYKNRYFKIFTNVSFVAIALTGFLPVERHDKTFPGIDLSRILWCGFGPPVFIFLIFITMPLAASFLLSTGKFDIWRKRLAVLSILLVILSFSQEARTVIDQGHTAYIINETFSFLAGNVPYVDYIPQYQSFYGFAILPFSRFLTSFQLLEVVFLGLFFLSLAAIFILVDLGRRCLPTKSWITASLLIIPLIGITPFGIRTNFSGSIAALLSAYPIRLFPGLILLSIVFYFYKEKHEIRKIDLLRFQIVLGFTCGLIVLQQQDFGIAAVCSVQLALLLEPSGNLKQKFQRASIIGFSMLATILILLGLLNFSTDGVHASYLGFFNRQFSGGFGSELIELPGPAMVILPLMFSLLVLHTAKLLKEKQLGEELQKSLIGFTATVWMIACLPYYINRSFASGQMQILFGLLGLSITCVVGQYYDEIKSCESVRKYYKLGIEALFLRSLIAFPLALTVLLPNPAFDTYRIYKGLQQERFINQDLKNTLSDLKLQKAWVAKKDPSASLAYFGGLGNWVQYESGVRSVNLFSNPNDWLISTKAFRLGCLHLKRNLPDYIYLDSAAINLFMNKPKEKCFTSTKIRSNTNLYKIEKSGTK